jgi:hypothetical protein
LDMAGCGWFNSYSVHRFITRMGVIPCTTGVTVRSTAHLRAACGRRVQCAHARRHISRVKLTHGHVVVCVCQHGTVSLRGGCDKVTLCVRIRTRRHRQQTPARLCYSQPSSYSRTCA